MDETTVKTLTDMREGLLSLARAHRNVVPPPSMTASQCAEWAKALGKIINGPKDVERDMTGFTHYAVTYSVDGTPAECPMPCMTVEGETTTDNFPEMIGARLWGDAKAGERRVTVDKFSEASEEN